MKLKVFILILSFLTLSFSEEVITGEAKELEFLKDRLIYKGNVKLVRNSSVLNADKVIVYLNKEGKPVRIVAKGKVKIIENERKAFSDYAEYDLTNEVIILKGNAKIQEKTRLLEADEIVIYRKENRLIAKGIKRKVRTVYMEEKQ